MSSPLQPSPQQVDWARRDMLAEQFTAVRSTLPVVQAGGVVDVSAITRAVLEQLAGVEHGELLCVVATLRATPHGSKAVADTSGLREHLMGIALTKIGASLRRSDLIVRVSNTQLGWLLSGTRPIEARGLAQRLRKVLDGSTCWYADVPLTMHCRVGFAPCPRPFPLDPLVVFAAAARHPIA
jgi:hypothetical protein